MKQRKRVLRLGLRQTAWDEIKFDRLAAGGKVKIVAGMAYRRPGTLKR